MCTRVRCGPFGEWVTVIEGTTPSKAGVGLLVLLAATASAAVALSGSSPLVIGFVGLIVVGILVSSPRLLPRVFVASLGVILTGYLFLGRGFAYLGLPPVYVGEVVLTLGLIGFLLNGGLRVWNKLPLWGPVTALVLIGLLRTVPYLAEYGVDALRDGAAWGYSLFSIFVAWAILTTNARDIALRWYSGSIQAFLALAPILIGLQSFFMEGIPRLPWGPGGGVPILNVKGGDVAVHLAGGAAFLALGLGEDVGVRTFLPEWVYWFGWVMTFGLVGIRGRAAFLTVVVGLVVLALGRPFGQWVRPLVIAAVAGSLLLLLDARVDVGTAREISVRQLVKNLASLTSDTGDPALEGSKQWRLLWWRAIVNYTFFGDYFWTGKGFGINLADDDGFQVYADHSLRSPHNGHLTFLARAGVPGLVAWITLQGTFAVSVLRAYRRAVRSAQDALARSYLWILVYWIAFMLNGAFDVFLEGPQGGIWFWSLLGFGMALLGGHRNQLNVAGQGSVWTGTWGQGGGTPRDGL